MSTSERLHRGVGQSGSIVAQSAGAIMPQLAQSYVEPLLAGDRVACRKLIDDALSAGVAPMDLLSNLIWPTMERLQAHYKEDRITITNLNLATRLNRWITDQLTGKLVRAESNGKKVLIFCGDDEPEELGGQICADVFEAAGYTVRFAGGGVPEDEVLKFIGEFRPELLIMFATLPSNVPGVRKLIDYLRDVNSCPTMQIMCCGGIYKRAEGLAEEIGADLYAADAADAVNVAEASPSQRATVDQQTVGRMRRIRKAAARKTAAASRPSRMNAIAALSTQAPIDSDSAEVMTSGESDDDNDHMVEEAA